MKRITAFAALILLCFFVSTVGATVSIVKNGSFEYDGLIADVTVEQPHYWCDVNIPAGKFGGYVSSFWSTHGLDEGYSLTLFSQYNAILHAGDMGGVSQKMFLEDTVREISFDLLLSSSAGPWDGNKRVAVVMLDGNDIWDSNDIAVSPDGEYIGEQIDINSFTDNAMHTLTLAIKSKVTETFKPYVEYQATWDFVKFDSYCGGLGYLPYDFDHDCYVDINDLWVLTDEWLGTQSTQFDLFADDAGTIDFRDFTVFASHWWDANCQEPDYCSGCDFDQSGAVDTNDLFGLAENWLNYSVLYSDIDGDGSVRFDDFAGFAGGWMQTSALWEYGSDKFSEPALVLLESDLNDDGIVDYDDLSIFSDNWLAGGGCVTADINTDGIVDFYDFLALAEQWRMKGTLYNWK